METYVDGFVIPVPKAAIERYRKIAEIARAVWMEYGALDYRESVIEDPDVKDMVSFPALAGAGPDETVVFAWITFRSRADRDAINAKVIADPRLRDMMGGDCPFDCKRMAYGGFRSIVGA